MYLAYPNTNLTLAEKLEFLKALIQLFLVLFHGTTFNMYCTEVKHLFWTLPLVAMPVRIFQKLTAKEVFFPVLSSPVLVVKY